MSWDNTGDGDFDAGDFCGALGYARSIRENVAVGGGLKLLSSSLGEDQASSYALDAGVLYEPLDGVSVGAAVRNLGPGIDFGGGSDPLPATIAAGASYAWREVLVALDVEKQNDLDPAARVGVEYRPMRSLALRGGAVLGSESALSAFSAGVGFSWNDRWSVDYAYRPSELTDTHHLGLSAALGGSAAEVVASPGSGPSSGPLVAMAPESNITVVGALTREVIAEALDRMTIPPGSSVYVAQVDKHDASWLVQSILLEELTSMGHVVKAGGIAGEEDGGAYEISYRVVSCETTLPRAWREWVVGARRVERKTTVDIYFQFANDSKDVLWAGNARRERREIIPGGLVKQLATPDSVHGPRARARRMGQDPRARRGRGHRGRSHLSLLHQQVIELGPPLEKRTAREHVPTRAVCGRGLLVIAVLALGGCSPMPEIGEATTEEMYALGSAAAAREDHLFAIEAMNRVLSQAPSTSLPTMLCSRLPTPTGDQEFASAEAEYDRLPVDYPRSPLVPEASYRSGSRTTISRCPPRSTRRRRSRDRAVRAVHRRVSRQPLGSRRDGEDRRAAVEARPEDVRERPSLHHAQERPGRPRDFEAVARDYPDTPWAPRALLALARSAAADGLPDEARGAYGRLAELYPESEEARTAALETSGQ